jgi:NAD kinase
MKKFENRIVIITRATRLEKVLEAQNTVSQAKFYINQLGGDFDEYQEEHSRYQTSLNFVRQGLDSLGNIQLLNRNYLPNFIFAPDDIVVAVGQDGLVANTLKYLNGQPLIGINPDPERWDGVLLPFIPRDAARITEETIGRRRKLEAVSMAKVRVQNGQELLAVNDFFIGQKTHISARYVIKFAGLRENQSSSGIIVSTGLGSTGWMKSIIAGASRINESIIGRPYGAAQESSGLTGEDMALEAVGKRASRELLFAVREPFPSKITGTNLVFGKITEDEPLRIESLMGENGVIFSDGMESDFIAFNSGTEAVITLAGECGLLVV